MTHVKHLITSDFTKQKRKPSKPEVGTINNNLRIVQEVDVELLAGIVSPPYSATFSPVSFDGNDRCNNNFVSQSIFALDFDSGIEPETVIHRFKEFNINPNFYYTSFSDTPELRKFRLVLFLDTVIKDIKQRDWIMLSLMKLFPESDTTCKDAARMFYGGKESTILSRDNIPFKALMEMLEINNITYDGNQTRCLGKSDKLFEKCSKTGSPIYNNIEVPEYLQKKKNNHFDFQLAANQVKILSDFANGEWLHHPELFGLATNLVWVKGGYNWMKKRMLQFNEDNVNALKDGEKVQYDENNFNILPYVKKKEYIPQRLSGFSPYEEDHQHQNILTSVTNHRGEIEQIEEIDKKPLKEVEEKFESEFEEVLKTSDNNIYIFKLPTGLGKTQKLTIKDNNSVIAVPTHDLKDEIYQRMNFQCTKTMKLVELEDDEMNKKIHHFYSIGASTRVHSLLKAISGDLNNMYFSTADVVNTGDYIMSNKRAIYSDNTVITTHKRALLNKFKHSTIIFDEDPIDSLFTINSFKITDLFKVSMHEQKLFDVVQEIYESKSGILYNKPNFTFNPDELIDAVISQNIDSNVLHFFNSSYYTRDELNKDVIHYITKRELPKDKKVIILSASVPVDIYKKVYGDRVKVVDISDVEMKGKIIQNTHKGFSRQSLKHDSTITECLGDTDVITFASYKHRFNNPVEEMHFGNCSGYDGLNGKNIAIVGTPHQPQYKYLLLAKALGIDFSMSDIVMTYKKVDWKGFRFMFNTFESEELQSIQLSLIEGELIQAVGRNRPLRQNVKTKLYSNLPLRIVTQFENQRLKPAG